MLVVKVKDTNYGVLIKKFKEYNPDPIVGSSAEKKETIVTQIMDEGDQLTLLATIVKQIGEKVGLDTPEFTYAKEIYANVTSVLGIEI